MIGRWYEQIRRFPDPNRRDQDGTKTIKALSVAKALDYSSPSQGVYDITTEHEKAFKGHIRSYKSGSYIQKYLTRKGLDLFLILIN